jgi:hypothetical protein
MMGFIGKIAEVLSARVRLARAEKALTAAEEAHTAAKIAAKRLLWDIRRTAAQATAEARAQLAEARAQLAIEKTARIAAETETATAKKTIQELEKARHQQECAEKELAELQKQFALLSEKLAIQEKAARVSQTQAPVEEQSQALNPPGSSTEQVPLIAEVDVSIAATTLLTTPSDEGCRILTEIFPFSDVTATILDTTTTCVTGRASLATTTKPIGNSTTITWGLKKFAHQQLANQQQSLLKSRLSSLDEDEKREAMNEMLRR